MDTLTSISPIITPILLIVVILLIIYLAKRKPQQEDSTTRILDQEIGQLKSDIEKFRIDQADHDSQKNKLKSEITSQSGTIKLLQNDIRDEQKALSIRLSTITGRLNYGEIELERTLELSGLKENIDYFLQRTIEDDQGNRVVINEQELIPDATIKLPKNRNIYIDAKYPDTAYTKLKNSHEADASTTYVRSFKTLINNLSDKGYSDSGLNTPGFCIMFVPGDHYILEAFKGDPSILDYGLQKNIVISTPGTLFSIIKTVELSFTREQLNKRAIEFERNAHQLINIAENFIKSFNDIDQRIKQLRESYEDIGTKVEGKQGLIRHLRTIAKGVGRELVKTTINEKDTDDKK